MTYKSIIISLFTLVSALVSPSLYAQSFSITLLSTAGQSANLPSGGSIDFSVGELFVQTAEAGGVVFTHGFEQPFYAENQDTSSSVATYAYLDVKVYPNPASEFVIVETVGVPCNDCSLELYDLSGKQITTQNADEYLTTLSLAGLSEQVYILRILKQNSVQAVYKFTKD